MSFLEKLSAASRAKDSLLCIGLDPDPALMPKVDIFSFNRAIIDATADLVCAYKPNLAFYEAMGIDGMRALAQTIEYIPKEIPVIGDAKRGDIGNTAQAYARALFDVWGFDAVTVNPYLGLDALEPFLERGDKGVFVLCRTSNPGSADFQSASLIKDADKKRGAPKPLYQWVALEVKERNVKGNAGLVVGATYPLDIKDIRRLCPDMPLLIPGVGAQGGDLASAVRFGLDRRGEGAIIAVSRQVLYASGGEDYARAARREAMKLRERINQYRSGARSSPE